MMPARMLTFRALAFDLIMPERLACDLLTQPLQLLCVCQYTQFDLGYAQAKL